MNLPSLLNRSLLTLVTCAAVSGTANAAILCWKAEHVGSPLDFLEEPWGQDSYDLSYGPKTLTLAPLDAATPAFNPAIHGISSIEVWFAFADDKPGTNPALENTGTNYGDVEEKVDITVGTQKLWDDEEVDGRHPGSGESYKNTYDYHPLSLTSGLAFDAIKADLLADGKVSYLVELQYTSQTSTRYEDKKREDTYLKVAGIKVTWNNEPERSVPEGGAGLALFGLTLAGLVGWRRRKS